MLAELAEYLITPCSPLARRLGYLKEAVAIGARSRRLRRAWNGHLGNCRAAILEAAGIDGRSNTGRQAWSLDGKLGGSPGVLPDGNHGERRDGKLSGNPDGRQDGRPNANRSRGTALILGSGSLLDIPLEELARAFDRVVLADLVHPLAARWRVRKLGNMVQDSVDVTGVLSGVLDCLTSQSRTRGLAGGLIGERKTPVSKATGPHTIPPGLPVPSLPVLYQDLNPALVVSANILSQLPLCPVKHLAATGRYSQEMLEDWSIALKQQHLAWLKTFPGTVLLLADTAWMDGGHEENALAGLNLPAPFQSWTWDIAPRPEVYPDRDVRHRVGAFLLKRGV